MNKQLTKIKSVHVLVSAHYTVYSNLYTSVHSSNACLSIKQLPTKNSCWYNTFNKYNMSQKKWRHVHNLGWQKKNEKLSAELTIHFGWYSMVQHSWLNIKLEVYMTVTIQYGLLNCKCAVQQEVICFWINLVVHPSYLKFLQPPDCKLICV
jgi:hypothetical protein